MVDHPVQFAIVSIVGKLTIKETVLHSARSVGSVAKRITSRLCISLVHQIRETIVNTGQEPKVPKRNFMKSTKRKESSMTYLTRYKHCFTMKYTSMP